jgi:uncharacterized membrane protein
MAPGPACWPASSVTTLGDMLSGWGFYWNWSLGNGLMGMLAGLALPMIKDFRARADIFKGITWGVIGIIVGMLFASLTEMYRRRHRPEHRTDRLLHPGCVR